MRGNERLRKTCLELPIFSRYTSKNRTHSNRLRKRSTIFSSLLTEIERDWSRFSCVVTDVDLGKGANGCLIARRAREFNHAAVVII